jgi:integrase
MRAPNRNWEALHPRTRRSYELYHKRYLQFAAANGFEPTIPSVENVLDFLRHWHARLGMAGVGKCLSALAHYFISRGLPVVVDHPDIRTFAEDLSGRTSDPVRGERHRRAQWYAENAYTDGTIKRYIKIGYTYIEYADERRFDPARPSIGQLETYVADLASRTRTDGKKYSCNWIRERCNAVSYYFRQCGTPDLFLTDRLKRVLQGISRERPPGFYRPIFIEQTADVIRQFDLSRPLDARDALLVALIANTGWRYEYLRRINRARIRFVQRGVVFNLDGGGKIRELFVGASTIADVNVVTLLRHWLGFIGTEPGPLFPGILPRGGYGSALSAVSMGRVVKLSLRILPKPESGRHASLSFRNAFVQRSVQRNGAVLTAHAMGAKRVDSLRRFVPSAGRDVALANKRKWNGRRPIRRVR